MAETEETWVSYREFFDLLADASQAKDFIRQLLDEKYVIPGIVAPEDVDRLSDQDATRIGREWFKLYYLLQCEPETEHWN